MREITLTQGKVALVDDEDFEYLNQWRWQVIKDKQQFYAVRTFHVDTKEKRTTKRIWMHRLIIKPSDNMQIDHINHNGLDNRKENLRIVTNRQNSCNRIRQAEFIGVSKSGKKFKASISTNGCAKHLGNFDTGEKAHEAYLEAVKSLIKQ